MSVATYISPTRGSEDESSAQKSQGKIPERQCNHDMNDILARLCDRCNL
ncbi:MAG: hypothetical protein WCP16_04795 [Pseudanabaena sp. ELA645]